MWTHERHNEIVSRISENGKVTTNALVDGLSVSRETIRRDLLELEQKGVIQRVHGGAVLATNRKPKAEGPNPTITKPNDPPSENSFQQRLNEKLSEKRAIAQIACTLIDDGSAIFIDAGTTTLAFAHALTGSAKGLKVITNSIEIAGILSSQPDYEVLLLGGIPNTEVNATYGELTLSDIERFHVDYSIISPVGAHSVYGFSSYHLREAEVARAMMRHSTKRIILAHAEKLGVQSRVKICSPESIDHLVINDTDSPDLDFPRCQIHKAFMN
ncbi:transcriptional regulator, DeoR family [Vibrio xiamenensis]|uniref:Transcriptional regulator, DeoR family n=1 Tax=Vibrio xiamenensis TaxID=861298 RepID=A0A1G8HCQ7_9VIBR|nr:DeoR/GlpR family DNA-binding transcription regulator [Vibrio xiamenensis]SDI04468.1 transcriptional regulator, DeoR family [Vibrio xiamenensis]